jgi:hypothetical protein
MARDGFLSESPPPASPASVERGSIGQSLWAVEQRPAGAERELRIQFIRIAQLQADLDLLQAALRHPPDDAHLRSASPPSCGIHPVAERALKAGPVRLHRGVQPSRKPAPSE